MHIVYNTYCMLLERNLYINFKNIEKISVNGNSGDSNIFFRKNFRRLC